MIYLMKLLTILSYFPPSITPSPSPISTNHDLSSDTNADILSSNTKTNHDSSLDVDVDDSSLPTTNYLIDKLF